MKPEETPIIQKIAQRHYEVTCPYCKHVNQMEPSDRFCDGEEGETECEECEKRFMYTISFYIAIEARAEELEAP